VNNGHYTINLTHNSCVKCIGFSISVMFALQGLSVCRKLRRVEISLLRIYTLNCHQHCVHSASFQTLKMFIWLHKRCAPLLYEMFTHWHSLTAPRRLPFQVLWLLWNVARCKSKWFMFGIVFWDVLPCKMIVDRRFRGAYCLHHQGWATLAHSSLNIILAAVRTWNLTKWFT
jgi:hypothetical protein